MSRSSGEQAGPGGAGLRALLAVSDRTGVAELGAGLVELGWELIATTGTADDLRSAGIPVSPAGRYTELPEMLGGRVRTLDVRIFAGLLYRRGEPGDEATMRRHRLAGIDLVACTFEPFDAATVATLPAGAARGIDVGGPAMIRAAAKNHAAVIALVDPADYAPVLAALRRAGGLPQRMPAADRRRLAAKAFRRTAGYDLAIAADLEQSG